MSKNLISSEQNDTSGQPNAVAHTPVPLVCHPKTLVLHAEVSNTQVSEASPPDRPATCNREKTQAQPAAPVKRDKNSGALKADQVRLLRKLNNLAQTSSSHSHDLQLSFTLSKLSKIATTKWCAARLAISRPRHHLVP